MISQAPDGWFIEQNSRFYHVNQAWLDEMFRHQVKPYGNNPDYNLLLHAFSTGADAAVIEARFDAFMAHRKAAKQARGRPGTHGGPDAFREFIKTQKGSRGNRD